MFLLHPRQSICFYKSLNMMVKKINLYFFVRLSIFHVHSLSALFFKGRVWSSPLPIFLLRFNFTVTLIHLHGFFRELLILCHIYCIVY